MTIWKRQLLFSCLALLWLSAASLPPGFAFSKPYAKDVEGSDWPQWRGPDRDGLSAETGLAAQWPEQGPAIQWRIPIGEGYSSVSVAGERLITMWDEGGDQHLYCLDTRNGEEIWKLRVGDSFRDAYGNGPRSTPVVDGDRVFVTSTDAQLYAVSAADGEVLWTHDLPEEYGGRVPAHGYASSPLVEGGRLFVEVGGKAGYAFIAFDKNSGDILWHSETDEPSYSSPIAVTIGGTRQILFLSAAGLFALSPEDGRLYWTYDWEARCPASHIPTNSSTPVFLAPDKIFLSGGYGTVTGAAVIQVRKQGAEFTTTELWNSKVMKNVLNSSLFYRGFLYGFDNNMLTCIDPQTGQEKWRTRGYQRGSLIAADGHLIVLSERGKLALVDPDPNTFRETASVQILDGATWAAPSLARGRLYIRSHTEMVCLNLAAESGFPDK